RSRERLWLHVPVRLGIDGGRGTHRALDDGYRYGALWPVLVIRYRIFVHASDQAGNDDFRRDRGRELRGRNLYQTPGRAWSIAQFVGCYALRPAQHDRSSGARPDAATRSFEFGGRTGASRGRLGPFDVDGEAIEGAGRASKSCPVPGGRLGPVGTG